MHSILIGDSSRHHDLAREPSPTELLQARREMVGYVDATGMAADLAEWCTSAHPAAGRLIHGPGGIGKTRLMIEVAARLRERAWTAGFLEPPRERTEAALEQRWQALDESIIRGEDQGLLLVLDHAEARQDEARRIAECLGGRAEDDTRPIRLVLLARGVGEWWHKLHGETPELQRLFRSHGATGAVISLPPIPAGRQRRALFDASIEAFAPWLAAQGEERPTGLPEPDRLGRIETSAGHPLVIEMEALLWLGSAAPKAGSTSTAVLLDRVLGLERRHWSKRLGKLDAKRTCDLDRGVAQVSAVRGVSTPASAERLLMADGFYQGRCTDRTAVDPVLRDLSHILGRADGGIDALQPDLIGEHHVATVGDVELIDGCVRWIEDEPPPMREERRRDLLTVLQRAAQPEHGPQATGRAVAMLDHLVGTHLRAFADVMVAAMIDAPGALADCLERRIDALDDDGLAAVDGALPLQSPSLGNLSLRVAQRRATLAQERLAHDDGMDRAATLQRRGHLAARLNTLVDRLSSLGRREEALAPSRQAVAIYRELAANKPEVFRPSLATALNSLAKLSSKLGDRKSALAPAREAVEIRRELAAKKPDAFRPHLAASLTHLAKLSRRLGDREGALASAREAADIHRELATRNPDAFRLALAKSLNSLAQLSSELGDRQGALTPAREATDIYRELAARNPEAFRAGLATSLNNLANFSSELGDRQGALAPAREAASIYRKLAAKKPEAFRPGLATSLNNLAKFLSELGDRQGALIPAREAVDIYRELAAKKPDAFRPYLAGSLNNLANRLSELGERQEALAPAREAVAIYRELAAKRPNAFRLYLAGSLNNLATVSSELGDRQGALAPAREAADIYRELAARNPEAFRPDLAMSLNNLANFLGELGDRQGALAPAREAVEIYRELALKGPEAFRPGLATSLNNLANLLGEVGDWQGALAPVREALALYRELAATDPVAFQPYLAAALNNLANFLGELGDRQGALASAREAVEALVPAFLRHPRAFAQWIATMAQNYLKRCQDCGREPDEMLIAPVVARLEEI